jgi:hypothetical protein
LKLCQHWRQFTEAEAAAIQAGDWVALAAVQRQKQELRAELDAVARPASLGRIRPLVDELIALELGNARALAERRQVAEGEQARFDLAGRNLRQLHQAYAPQSSAVWHSYS